MKLLRLYILRSSLYCCLLLACNKGGFLDEKPDKRLLLLETFSDFQSVLDNSEVMNGNNQQGIVPAFVEAASDNYYILNSGVTLVSNADLNIYKWNDDIYGSKRYDWSFNYRCIFYSNVVLGGIRDLDRSKSPGEFDNITGQALFFRAHSLYWLVQTYAPIYNKESASTDLGVPLRQGADLNEKIKRASVKENYEQIINDLMESIYLLPEKAFSNYRYRPYRASALGLLARTYLAMRVYDSAYKYADECLKLNSDLIDFGDPNEIDPNNSFPLQDSNKEVLFPCYFPDQNMFLLLHTSIMRVDSNLYNSYKDDDMRKAVFFRLTAMLPRFKGNYTGGYTLFGGIALDEIYLIKAEAGARIGNFNNAIDDLNNLMIKRWKKDEFIPFVATDKEEALRVILDERRKELLFRGLRWTDLRRLNKEGANIQIQRNLNNQVFSLQPNDKRYTFLIPPDVISLNPGMPQNLR